MRLRRHLTSVWLAPRQHVASRCRGATIINLAAMLQRTPEVRQRAAVTMKPR